MGEFPPLSAAVRIIDCLTREDYDLGARAFKLWSKLHGQSASNCVTLARKEREVRSHIRSVEIRNCNILEDLNVVKIMTYDNGIREIHCRHLNEESCDYSTNKGKFCSYKN